MLLGSLTPCILKAQESLEDENVTFLREDTPAPHDGYLTQPPTFRQMLTDVRQGQQFKSEFEKCLESKAEPEFDSRAMWFGGGVIMTMITIFAITVIAK